MADDDDAGLAMAPQAERHDRLLQERVHDPYKLRAKIGGAPAVCGRCGAAFHHGRWQWLDHRPAGAEEETCPACRRIADDCPAGFLYIQGLFAEAHREEIRGLIRHVAETETADHPLDRIMAIATHDGGMTITTTDIHLARRLGEALRRAYRGDLSFHYQPGESLLRLRWIR